MIASNTPVRGNLTWRRMDLHIHTPGSSDYQEPRISYLDILQRAEARGLDIIAFTDHNSVAGYASMQREIEQLEFLAANSRILPDEARQLQEYRRLRERILVLPGFEFTATFGFHILGIFPAETSVRKLEHLLLELNIPEERLDQGTSEVGATTDVLRAYEIIADNGGLVCGAHVNSTHGVAMIGLGLGGQTKIAYTQDPHLHALEVTDLESTSRRATTRFFNGSKPEYPRRMHCIQGSDAHRLTRDPQRPEKNLGVGDRPTEVLIPDVSFAALRDLFTSTEFSRTRPYRPPEEHPFDPLTAARAEGATIVQSFHDTIGPARVWMKGVLRDLVAFANTNGGTLYVGVSTDHHEPIRGVENASALCDHIRTEATRQIVPPLAPEIEMLASENKTVVVVTVPKGTDTPYALDPGYIYVRQEGETTLALRDEIVQLARASLPESGADFPDLERPSPSQQNAADLVTAVQASHASASAALETAPRGRRMPVAAPSNLAQQVAVQQATAAEQDRQQDRTPVPRTGVEIIASVERNGLTFHTLRDLRNRRVVRNVTRKSARRLWRYAILLVEDDVIHPDGARWSGEDRRFGFLGGFQTPDHLRRYNLAYREPPRDGTEGTGRVRVFFGVTEDGIDERWRAVLPPDGEFPVIIYDDQAPEEPDSAPPAPATAESHLAVSALAGDEPEEKSTPEETTAPPGSEAEAAPPATEKPTSAPRGRRARRATPPAATARQSPGADDEPASESSTSSTTVSLAGDDAVTPTMTEAQPRQPARRHSRRSQPAPAAQSAPAATEQGAEPAPATDPSAPKPRRRAPRRAMTALTDG